MALRGETWLALTLVGCALACSDAEAERSAMVLDLRGTRIDGQEDPEAQRKATELATATAHVENARPADEPERVDRSDGAETDPPVDPEPEPELDSELELAGAEAAAEPKPDENAELGRLREDGVRELTFKDLSLEGIDYELLVDTLLFPEEYAEDGVELPANVAALSGQEISIQGYMIPGKIARGGNVRDFMLVRDLLACCFGGIPKPDEWIDVVMAEDAEAEYIRYMPLVVTGTLSVGQDMDVDAFNPAVFQLVGTEVRRRE